MALYSLHSRAHIIHSCDSEAVSAVFIQIPDVRGKIWLGTREDYSDRWLRWSSASVEGEVVSDFKVVHKDIAGVPGQSDMEGRVGGNPETGHSGCYICVGNHSCREYLDEKEFLIKQLLTLHRSFKTCLHLIAS